MGNQTTALTPIQNETGVHVNSLEDTTYEQAFANSVQSVTTTCANFNVKVKGIYLDAFNRWAQNVDIGRPDGTPPPQPPPSFVVEYFVDPTSTPTKQFRWPYPSQTGPAVCEMPPVPGTTVHSLGVAKVGNAVTLAPGWFQSLAGDTTPGGTVVPTTSLDGVFGLFLKIASPFGTNLATGEIGGVYQKVG